LLWMHESLSPDDALSEAWLGSFVSVSFRKATWN